MRRSGKVAVGDMALLAAKLDVSGATAFRLIKLFRARATVIATPTKLSAETSIMPSVALTSEPINIGDTICPMMIWVIPVPVALLDDLLRGTANSWILSCEIHAIPPMRPTGS